MCVISFILKWSLFYYYLFFYIYFFKFPINKTTHAVTMRIPVIIGHNFYVTVTVNLQPVYLVFTKFDGSALWIHRKRNIIIYKPVKPKKYLTGGVAQWVARLTAVVEQETLPLLLSTGWFQERIRAWFHNKTKINWEPYGRLT